MSAASVAFTYVARKFIVGTLLTALMIRAGLFAPSRILFVLMLGSGPWQMPNAQLIGALLVFSYSCLPRTAFCAWADDAPMAKAASSVQRRAAQDTLEVEIGIVIALSSSCPQTIRLLPVPHLRRPPAELDERRIGAATATGATGQILDECRRMIDPP
jgi:hypothetical protein